MKSVILLLAKRLLLVLPVVWAVVTLVFLLIHIVPGDPVRFALGDNATAAQVAELKHRLGLDLPLGEQYVNYWRGLLGGDLGVSLVNPADQVLEKVLARYPATIELTLAGLLVALLIAIPLGVTAGTRGSCLARARSCSTPSSGACPSSETDREASASGKSPSVPAVAESAPLPARR